ncbi:MAG: hypothetical protein H0W69_10290 [Gemmatimonadaceae bacterium]|nr:hypothetical protein [Gemmatimonadaceae bacterium]
MLEIVVSILLLTVGALGYAAVTARLARAFFIDAQRSRSGDLIAAQRETLIRQGCGRALPGTDNRFNMALQWSVESPGVGAQPVTISAIRPGFTGTAHDSLRTDIPCI